MTESRTLASVEALAEFALARIAEDEATAHEAADWASTDWPARILAECEAKRRIVKYALSWAGEYTGTDRPLGGPYGEAMLRAMVQIWKAHPDFNARDWLI